MRQMQSTAGLTPLQLEKLCQTDQVEETMRLLFALNHWAKARDRLFFADRQGLYQLKAALLQEAYARGLMLARAYVDGKEGFGKDLAFDLASDIAAEGFLWRLEELASDPYREHEDMYEQIVHQLYTRITGNTTICASDVERLEASQVHEYMLKCLQELEHEARVNSQPIPCKKLTALCIAPSDLLSIQDHRYYDLGNWDSWEQLDACDLRKLDPEGLSLLAFDYTSPTAHYVFHLPLRVAETFVPPEQIARLKVRPWTSRESGEYYGRSITAAESLEQPITEILRDLGADIMAICPRQLRDKEYSLMTRYTEWYDEIDEDTEQEDELETAYWHSLIRSSLATTWREPDACPYCATPVASMPELARVEHWQNEHSGLDLTISQASWLMNCTCLKKAFCQRYPPDYRAPHEHGWGTRYWKVTTLKAWMQERLHPQTV